jgi:uncharacterized membrane protein YjjP (DUF1212 family)
MNGLLQLVTDERAPMEQAAEEIKRLSAESDSYTTQLLCSVVLVLAADVKRLKQQVKELQHCQSA